MTQRSARAVWLAISAVLAVGGLQFHGPAHAQAPGSNRFAQQVRELSEPGGSFDTDNLISNERSYLHVLPALKQGRVAGGAYVGVGPDQNFSYIAAIRPSVAYVIDVRRDNLLLHLLFKALFEMSETRAEYLGHLFGRRLPTAPDQWRGASLEQIAAQLDAVSPRGEDVQVLRRQVDARIAGFGIPLSASDVGTIERFHKTFIDAGLSLKFQSWGRAPRSYYPTYRELLFETDRARQRGNFLIDEEGYQFVRGLQQRDAIVPVVGNLAGPKAMSAIGRAMKQRGEELSALYVSNVELYLFQDGVFPRYVENLGTLPRNGRSVIIRSVFSGPALWSMPDTLPGYASASLVQRVDEFASRRYRTYGELLGNSR
ncbi:MAG: hypothetical protein ND807_13075 [Vicinamibacterales bacterium]|nr:hypothetical protein [Vicinamibacterales bacterium]